MSQMMSFASSLCRICARISHECSTVSPDSQLRPWTLRRTLSKVVITSIARYFQLGPNAQPRALGFGNRYRLQNPLRIARKVQRPLPELATGRQRPLPPMLVAHSRRNCDHVHLDRDACGSRCLSL